MVQTFQNNSCSPFLAAANGTCALGNLAQYAINVADASSMVAGIKFARANNIRLIVKNTGTTSSDDHLAKDLSLYGHTT